MRTPSAGGEAAWSESLPFATKILPGDRARLGGVPTIWPSGLAEPPRHEVLDLEEFFLLVGEERVDLGHDVVGELLELLFDQGHLVFGDLRVLLDFLADVTPDVPDGDTGVFRQLLH